MSTCPLCGATASTSHDEELRFRCDVCGGPIVPSGASGVRRSGKEITALKRANDARKARTRYRSGAILAGLGLAGVLGIMAILGVLSMLIGFSSMYPVAGLVFAVPLAFAVLWSLARARDEGKKIGPALDAAWLVAATDVVQQSRGEITPRTLAEALRIEEGQAEELLALLDASDIVRGSVGASGALTYQPRVRIDASVTGAPAQAEADAEAEAEAALAGRAQDKKQGP
jgi:hypothetical protein